MKEGKKEGRNVATEMGGIERKVGGEVAGGRLLDGRHGRIEGRKEGNKEGIKPGWWKRK